MWTLTDEEIMERYSEYLDARTDPLEEVVLDETKTTRLVLRTETFPSSDQTAGLNITGALFHQRRSPLSDHWDDVKAVPLSKIHKDEQVKIDLGHEKLKSLFVALAKRFGAMGGVATLLEDAGIATYDPDIFSVVEGRQREVVDRLSRNDPNFWNYVEEIADYGIMETISLKRQNKRHKLALNTFRLRMEDSDWGEKEWQRFFFDNQWIFGLGTSHRFLHMLQWEASVGASSLDGKGEDIVDFLMNSEGERRFTTLIDIKKPQTPLVREYRSDIHFPTRDVIGGVAQVLSYCDHWAINSLANSKNRKTLRGLDTFNPKGILIVGNLNRITEDDEKVRCFELFRRGLSNPEILTFDEMLARAEHIVAIEAEELNELERIQTQEAIDDSFETDEY